MSGKEKLIVVFGCGGHSHNIADIILYNEPDSRILFVDDNAQEGETKLGFSVVKTIPEEEYKCIIAIGSNMKRKQKFEQIDKARLTSVLSQRAHIGRYAKIGKGSYVGHLAIVGAEAVIGENTFISYASVVGHETQIGCHSFVGPNATIMGKVKVDDLVFIGGGVTIINGVAICSNSIIGAGATVVGNILEPGTYVGSPARRIK
ncbi:MAG: acyltransferase, left-handed parallel beta-helix (hexapeptide repeat) family [Firmicutes bacterium]|nr:acyltransferase, left-handed parallel beta-helix (hexapeptide repeat) family [Bacillota bacterium]